MTAARPRSRRAPPPDARSVRRGRYRPAVASEIRTRVRPSPPTMAERTRQLDIGRLGRQEPGRHDLEGPGQPVRPGRGSGPGRRAERDACGCRASGPATGPAWCRKLRRQAVRCRSPRRLRGDLDMDRIAGCHRRTEDPDGDRGPVRHEVLGRERGVDEERQTRPGRARSRSQPGDRVVIADAETRHEVRSSETSKDTGPARSLRSGPSGTARRRGSRRGRRHHHRSCRRPRPAGARARCEL